MNLQDEIDIAFAKTVDELREKHAASVGEQNFSGQVTGVMLKTAIKLAKEGGCPEHVLKESVLGSVREVYGKGGPGVMCGCGCPWSMHDDGRGPCRARVGPGNVPCPCKEYSR